MSHSLALTSRRPVHSALMSVAANGEARQVSLSSDSSVRTLCSLAGSVMRCDLISRIVILSISSPGEMGTSNSAMHEK